MAVDRPWYLYCSVASNSIYSRLLIAAVDNLRYLQHSARCGKYSHLCPLSKNIKDDCKIVFFRHKCNKREENKKQRLSTKSLQKTDASPTNPKHGYIWHELSVALSHLSGHRSIKFHTRLLSCTQLLHQSKCIEYYNNPRSGGRRASNVEETAIGKWGQDLLLLPG